jgi:adenylate cyclase
MAIEIERKYAVIGDFKSLSTVHYHIAQGYLSTVPERTVRVRIKNDKAFLTIKGIAHNNGISRYEWEKEISVHEAEELLNLCEPFVIRKTRYEVYFENQKFEIDEFCAENEGLLIAELELESEDTIVNKPLWLGDEIVNDERYFNSQLSKNPFKLWSKSNN